MPYTMCAFTRFFVTLLSCFHPKFDSRLTMTLSTTLCSSFVPYVNYIWALHNTLLTPNCISDPKPLKHSVDTLRILQQPCPYHQQLHAPTPPSSLPSRVVYPRPRRHRHFPRLMNSLKLNFSGDLSVTLMLRRSCTARPSPHQEKPQTPRRADTPSWIALVLLRPQALPLQAQAPR